MTHLPHYVVLYDSACRICTAQAHTLARYDTNDRLKLLDLNSADARKRYPQIAIEDAQRWMHLVGPSGRIWRGADALRQLLLLLPAGHLLGVLMYVPGIMVLARPLYNWFARNRYRFGGFSDDACADGACAIHLGRGVPAASTHRHQPAAAGGAET